MVLVPAVFRGCALPGPLAVTLGSCCPIACGRCGGSGCAKRAGGRSTCCAEGVSLSNRSCHTHKPPCVLQKDSMARARARQATFGTCGDMGQKSDDAIRRYRWRSGSEIIGNHTLSGSVLLFVHIVKTGGASVRDFFAKQARNGRLLFADYTFAHCFASLHADILGHAFNSSHHCSRCLSAVQHAPSLPFVVEFHDTSLRLFYRLLPLLPTLRRHLEAHGGRLLIATVLREPRSHILATYRFMAPFVPTSVSSDALDANASPPSGDRAGRVVHVLPPAPRKSSRGRRLVPLLTWLRGGPYPPGSLHGVSWNPADWRLYRPQALQTRSLTDTASIRLGFIPKHASRPRSRSSAGSAVSSAQVWSSERAGHLPVVPCEAVAAVTQLTSTFDVIGATHRLGLFVAKLVEMVGARASNGHLIGTSEARWLTATDLARIRIGDMDPPVPQAEIDQYAKRAARTPAARIALAEAARCDEQLYHALSLNKSGLMVVNRIAPGEGAGVPGGVAGSSFSPSLPIVSGIPMVASASTMITMQVMTPPTSKGGDTISIHGPDGTQYQVTVPMGVGPGQAFNTQIPAPAAPMAVAVATPMRTTAM